MLLRRAGTGRSISKLLVYPNRPPLQGGRPQKFAALPSVQRVWEYWYHASRGPDHPWHDPAAQ